LVETYGLDPVRYFLMREVPFGNDGDFSHSAMMQRMNSDLANDLGNLCQRVLSMVGKNCSAQMPTPGTFTEADNALLDKVKGLIGPLREAMRTQTFHAALTSIWDVIGDANRYVDTQAPWALRKTDPPRMGTVLYTLSETIRIIAFYVQPFMPDACAKILDQLSVAEDARNFDSLDIALEAGTALPKPAPVFPRFVVEDEG